MSGIGDYVHLKAVNYIKYGIGKDSTTAEYIDITGIHNITKKKLKEIGEKTGSRETLDIQALKDLIAILNAIKNYDDEENTDFNKILNEAFEASLSETMKGVINDIDNEKKRKQFDIQYTEKAEKPRIGEVKENKKAYLAEKKALILRKHLQELVNKSKNSSVSELIPAGRDIGKDIIELGNIITALEKEFQLEKRNETYFENPETLHLTSKMEINEEGAKTLKDFLRGKKDLKEMIEKLNKMLLFYTPYYAFEDAKGKFFEQIVKRVPDFSGLVADGILKNKFKDTGKKGTDTNEVTFKEAVFSKEYVDFKELFSLSDDLNGQVSYKESSSQGKIDIGLTWHSGKKPLQLNISAKNISGIKNITVVEGTSVLFFLQDLLPEFVNHFLNMIVQHEDNGELNQINNEITVMKWNIKLIFLAMALTGDVGGRDIANVFLINDNTKNGKVRAIFMGDIINNMIQIIEKTDDSSFTRFVSNPFNRELKTEIPNSFVGDKNNLDNDNAQKRITNVLQEVHKRKLTMSINQGLFSDLSKKENGMNWHMAIS